MPRCTRPRHKGATGWSARLAEPAYNVLLDWLHTRYELTMHDTRLHDLINPICRFRQDRDSLQTYGRDWNTLYSPHPDGIVFPETIAQVIELVQLANAHRLALVPSGGRTGLSGGATACNGELVVSFERMNRILDFDPIGASVTCQAGVITQTLQEYALEQGLYYPVDFAARGSSQIGGNIATNAGGIKVIRYGLTRNWVSGLKVVTGKGELLNLNKGLIKNATGYDLRHLFIGSEGTLGLIVEATLQLTRPPREPRVLVLAVPELSAVMEVFAAFRKQVELIAFEFFTEGCLHHVAARGVPRPFAEPSAYYALIEFESPTEEAMDNALALFEDLLEQGLVTDGVASESEAQAQALWQLRDDITEATAHYRPYKNDISVPVGKVASFMAAADELLAREYPDFEVIWFGHIGDGNLHIGVLKPDALDDQEFARRCAGVTEQLCELLARFDGSISAEHGVGLSKKPYLGYTRSTLEIDYLRSLKQVFDPNGILNPGKIFDL